MAKAKAEAKGEAAEVVIDRVDVAVRSRSADGVPWGVDELCIEVTGTVNGSPVEVQLVRVGELVGGYLYVELKVQIQPGSSGSASPVSGSLSLALPADFKGVKARDVNVGEVLGYPRFDALDALLQYLVRYPDMQDVFKQDPARFLCDQQRIGEMSAMFHFSFKGSDCIGFEKETGRYVVQGRAPLDYEVPAGKKEGVVLQKGDYEGQCFIQPVDEEKGKLGNLRLRIETQHPEHLTSGVSLCFIITAINMLSNGTDKIRRAGEHVVVIGPGLEIPIEDHSREPAEHRKGYLSGFLQPTSPGDPSKWDLSLYYCYKEEDTPGSKGGRGGKS